MANSKWAEEQQQRGLQGVLSRGKEYARCYYGLQVFIVQETKILTYNIVL